VGGELARLNPIPQLGAKMSVLYTALTPQGLAMLRHPSGALAGALRIDDSGARVPVVNLGTPDNQGSRHYGSNVAGTAQIVRWFSEVAP
jgi:hypothetical protein